jgi:mRNA interferase RelE/StbE
MSIKVEWSPKAARDLDAIGDRKMRERVIATVYRFSESGHGDVKKLQGKVNEYRLRVGDWRVRFTYENKQQTILVLRVLPRGKAYSGY